MKTNEINSEYQQAANKLRNSGNSVVGKLGETVMTATGGTAGYFASGTIASSYGASTLMGSTVAAKCAIWIGAPVVLTTPVGWVIGSVVAGSAIGLIATKVIKSGFKSDMNKEKLINELRQ